jgi:hypothetical protein
MDGGLFSVNIKGSFAKLPGRRGTELAGSLDLNPTTHIRSVT